ncbi:non-ribosomal peptide synthetase [Psychrobacter aquimaris]|uniref:non-ribosomal peptide synthetase n=1 Tax=Psychrobacter aquimaris TaxID=292733 RepID=UPI003FD5324C
MRFQLSKQLNVNISLRCIFEKPTIALLVEDAKDAQEHSIILKDAKQYTNDKRPLSITQKSLWFLHEFEQGNAAYNIPCVIKFKGFIDQSALIYSLHKIVQRHEVLRCNVVDGEDGLMMCVLPGNITVEVLDIDDPENIEKQIFEESSRPFNLNKDRLMRARLLKINDKENILQLTFHHIVFDGWSVSILIKELANIYNLKLNKKTKSENFDSLQIQYADYVEAQSEKIQRGSVSEPLQYWSETLKNINALNNFPTDRPRAALKTFKGDIKQFRVDTTTAIALRELSSRSNASLYMILLSAFYLFLYRYSGSDDQVVGTPIANRETPETHSLIGLFVNTVVMRAQLDGDKKYIDFLKEVKANVLDAYSNQDIPFELIVNTINPERSTSYNPFFQYMFAFQNQPRVDERFLGLDYEVLEVNTRQAKFDLTLFLEESPEGLVGNLEYNCDLFNCATIINFINHFQMILAEIVENDQRTLGSFSATTETEKTLLLDIWNNTNVDFDRGITIHELFERQAAQRPEAVAIRHAYGQISYGLLNQQANQFARRLMDLGVGPNSFVGVYMERTVDLIVVLLGILKAGGAYVPIDTIFPSERIKSILEDSGASLLISEKTLEKNVDFFANILCINEDFWDKNYDVNIKNVSKEVIGLSSANVAYVIYTSGSTGKPKGVVVAHQSAVNIFDWFNREFNITPQDKLLFITSICFDLSVYDIFGILASGASFYLADKEIVRNPINIANILIEEEITLWDSAPAALIQLMPILEENYKGVINNYLRLVFLSGDWIPLDIPDRLYRVFSNVEVISLGGATEATIWSNYYRIDEVCKDWVSIPYGKPIQNSRYYVLDSNMQLCPIGVAGDLYIAGECLALEYKDAPVLNRDKFVSDPFFPGERMYLTGDMARWTTNGNMQFLGRNDSQVKVRGYRVELGEIEKVLLNQTGIKAANVQLLTDHANQQYLCAYIVSDILIDTRVIKTELKKELPDYMVPSFVTVIDKLPLTSNGKLDRKALPNLSQLKDDGKKDQLLPKTNTEIEVSKIISEVIAATNVGLNDNLFDIGVTSLTLTTINQKLNKYFEKQISLTDLFQRPDVYSIASYFNDENTETDILDNVFMEPEDLLGSLSVFQIND